MINENKQSSAEAWEFSLGVIKIDGLKPSDDFLELVEKEKKGDITDKDILKVLNKKYKMKGEQEKK